MSTERPRQRARLNTTISDATCPGLIGYLNQVPAGDKDPLIRAILLEWFERHAEQGNLDAAVAELAGRSKLAAALQKAGLPNQYLPQYAPAMQQVAGKPVAPAVASLPVRPAYPAPVAGSLPMAVASSVTVTEDIVPVLPDRELSSMPAAGIGVRVAAEAFPGHLETSVQSGVVADDDDLFEDKF